MLNSRLFSRLEGSKEGYMQCKSLVVQLYIVCRRYCIPDILQLCYYHSSRHCKGMKLLMLQSASMMWYYKIHSLCDHLHYKLGMNNGKAYTSYHHLNCNAYISKHKKDLMYHRYLLMNSAFDSLRGHNSHNLKYLSRLNRLDDSCYTSISIHHPKT